MPSSTKINYIFFFGLIVLAFSFITQPIKAESVDDLFVSDQEELPQSTTPNEPEILPTIVEPDLIPSIPTETLSTPSDDTDQVIEQADTLISDDIGDLSKCEFISDPDDDKYIICKRKINEGSFDIWLKDSTEINVDHWTSIVSNENLSASAQAIIYKNILFYLSPDKNAVNAYNLENGSTFSQTLEPGSWIEFNVETQNYIAKYENDAFSFSIK